MGATTPRGFIDDMRTTKRFLGLRAIVLTLVVGAGIVILHVTARNVSLGPLYALLLVGYAGGGLLYAGVRMGVSPVGGYWALMVFDVLLETMIIHYSGGMMSQFSLVYCLSIIAAAFFLQVHGGLGIAVFASFCFACYGILESQGALHPVVEARDPGAFAGGVLHMYLHVSLFFVVGAVSGYLTQRTRSEGRQLRNAKTKLRQLRVDTDRILEHMSSGVLVVDRDGKVLTVNPMAEQILGVDKLDIVGLHVGTAFDPLTPEFAREVLEALDSDQGKLRNEIAVKRGMGIEVPLGLSISILKDEQNETRGVIAVFQDLTEVREMQERVRKADRLAAIGELSAGIAHEIRNPLASISGAIEMLSNELELRGENQRLMELVMKESDRLDRIINDFLEFARLRPPTRGKVSVSKCLDEVLMLLSNNPALMCGIETEVSHAVGEIVVEFDEEQLKQVLFNLTINAFEAMQGSGTLSIRTGMVDDDTMQLVFQDEGPGIADSERARLFEPFFTTKDGGTGLGLAIANKIVEAHGGRIGVRNRAERGAEFSIVIPLRSAVEEESELEVMSPVV
jgi:two-component system sensor histidine kinase PilS (NtrC family)